MMVKYILGNDRFYCTVVEDLKGEEVIISTSRTVGVAEGIERIQAQFAEIRSAAAKCRFDATISRDVMSPEYAYNALAEDMSDDFAKIARDTLVKGESISILFYGIRGDPDLGLIISMEGPGKFLYSYSMEVAGRNVL